MSDIYSYSLTSSFLGGFVLIIGSFMYYYQSHCNIRRLSTIEEEDSLLENDSGLSRKKRSMSFNSACLIDGTFPSYAKVTPPIINILILFDTCPSEQVLIDKLQLILKYDRLRLTPKNSFFGWKFVYTGNVDIKKNHMTTIEVPSETEMLNYFEKLIGSDIHGYNEIPLWQVYRIINSGSGPSCLVLRLHHVIGDGISLINVLSQLFIDSETNDYVNWDRGDKMRSTPSSPTSPRVQRVKPPSFIFQLLRMVQSFFEVLGLATSTFDSDIKFTSQNKKNLVMSSKSNKTVYFPTIRLDFVKELKDRYEVTVNDILLSAMAGAIRRYCVHQDDPLFQIAKDITNRILLPVAFPRPKEETEVMHKAMRNKWAFISIKMPLNDKEPSDRIASCFNTTTPLKSSPTPLVQLWVQTYLIPLLPPFLRKQIAYDLFTRHSLVFSNLPGPSNICKFQDSKVVGLQVVFPNLIPQVILCFIWWRSVL